MCTSLPLKQAHRATTTATYCALPPRAFAAAAKTPIAATLQRPTRPVDPSRHSNPSAFEIAEFAVRVGRGAGAVVVPEVGQHEIPMAALLGRLRQHLLLADRGVVHRAKRVPLYQLGVSQNMAGVGRRCSLLYH